MMNSARKRRAQRGVTLVESLVALVVLSMGMLGVASLYIAALKAGRSALVRTQAVNLASDLADRIRANREALNAYDTGNYDDDPQPQACMVNNCTPEQIAEDDLAVWMTTLRTVMPGDTEGTVQFQDQPGTAPNQYTIRVSWRESGETEDSSTELVVEL